ncbi:hypothetical protein [Pseudomonas viridiflava]|uniref:hypothetical protein n=1 Tax=Pseudomonas viridiflava TaxID=33069 RepID=UPI000F052918|nr:hypothetical protein [Pseudomonas viridiflava]
MFSDEKKIIQEQWLEEIYPRTDSITSGNGFFCLFDLAKDDISLKNKIWIPASDYYSLDSNASEGLSTINKIEGFDDSIVQCGECFAAGEDGFIALTRKHTEELVWLVVLSKTNPFENLKVEGAEIHAYSSNGVTVQIPMERPDKLIIHWR